LRKEKKKRLIRISQRQKQRRDRREEFFVEGRFSAARAGFGFVDLEDGTSVFVPEKFTNEAIDGDFVRVQILPERRGFEQRESGPAGRVVEIIDRNRETFVGEILAGFRVKALDPKLPDFIRVYGSRHGAEIGDWVKLKLESVEDGVCYCKIIKVIGKAGIVASDLDAVCEEYDLPAPYTEEENEASFALHARDIFRIDRRNITSYAIDPVDAKDQDDALSVSERENSVVIGVHISDVAAYIAPKSRFDAAALKRTFSCYLPGRTLPMLPAKLTEKLSVGSGSNVLVHTVFLEIEKSTGKIVGYSREHSLMNAAMRMNYDEVQEFLESGRHPESWSEKHCQDVALLLETSAKMREYRAKHEKFIDLPLPECHVVCDELHNRIAGIVKRVQRKSEQLVEECMLAANSAVGRELVEKSIAGLYRVHAEPTADKLVEFSETMEQNFGIRPGDISVRENCIEFIKSLPDDPRRPLILNMLLRSLARADYSSKGLEHFALGKTKYCHFTSPIRRYTDLAVHQQFWNYDCKVRLRNSHTFESLAERCTAQEEICDAASFAASDRMKLRYLEMLLEAGDDTVYEGVISRVTSYGLQVDVSECGVYGFVPMEVINRHPENARRSRRGEYHIGDYIYLRLARIDFVRNSCIFVPAGRVV
jgi:ribonuclease R